MTKLGRGSCFFFHQGTAAGAQPLSPQQRMHTYTHRDEHTGTEPSWDALRANSTSFWMPESAIVREGGTGKMA